MRTKDIDTFTIYEQKDNPRYIEALVQLQSNINLASGIRKFRVIAITSAEEDDGKSTLACNLAYAYALQGKKVIMIDLDLRKSVANKFFKVPRENGVVEYCAEDMPLEQVIKHSSYNVDIISSGKHTSFPVELIQSGKMVELIEQLKKDYEYIIVDTPPVLFVTDCLVAAPFIDGFVLTVRQGHSKLSALREANKVLKQNNAHVIGCAITNMNAHDKGYYYYYGEKK